MERSYNLRSPAVKRLMREAQELREPTKDYCAKPLDDNLFEWHFTFRGPEDSEFEGGFYHGRIILPPEYPMKPPSIMLLNPNGRFELNKKICLSISGYHPESWQPSWSIRTAILAIIAFMPSKGEGAIGALDYTPDERKILAKKSQTYTCSSCGVVSGLLSTVSTKENVSPGEKKDMELAKQILFNKPKESNKRESQDPKTSTNQSEPEVETPAEETLVVEEVNNSTETDSTVRQRVLVEPSISEEPTPAVTVLQNAIPTTQSNDEKTSLVLIIVLIIVIVLLLFRRFNRAYNFTDAIL